MPTRKLPADWSAAYHRQTNQLPGYTVSDIRAICPYCRTNTTFNQKAADFEATGGQVIARLIVACNYGPCRRVSSVQIALSNSNPPAPTGDFLMHPLADVDSIHVSIPAGVADDWKEAQKAFQIGAPKAAAVMCRRVLYGILLQQGCKEHPLHEAVADLIEKRRLPSIFDEWLPAIKDDGHDAAHPYRSLNIDTENVAETLEYTRELLRFVYIEPYEFLQRKARINGS